MIQTQYSNLVNLAAGRAVWKATVNWGWRAAVSYVVTVWVVDRSSVLPVIPAALSCRTFTRVRRHRLPHSSKVYCLWSTSTKCAKNNRHRCKFCLYVYLSTEAAQTVENIKCQMLLAIHCADSFITKLGQCDNFLCWSVFTCILCLQFPMLTVANTTCSRRMQIHVLYRVGQKNRTIFEST